MICSQLFLPLHVIRTPYSQYFVPLVFVPYLFPYSRVLHHVQLLERCLLFAQVALLLLAVALVAGGAAGLLCGRRCRARHATVGCVATAWRIVLAHDYVNVPAIVPCFFCVQRARECVSAHARTGVCVSVRVRVSVCTVMHSHLSKDCVLCASEDLSVDMPPHAQIPLSALLHVCCGAVRPDVTCPFGTMACGCSACPLLLVFAYVAVPLYQLAKLLQAWSVADHHASQQTQQPKPHSGAAFSLRSAMSPPRCTNMSVRST